MDAALRVLGRRPGASVEDVAHAAGVARQTVYAHFASREALLGAVVARMSEEALAAIDAAGIDDGPATDALVRLVDAAWDVFRRHPALPAGADALTPEESLAQHAPVAERLMRLVERGQAAGEFDGDLPPAWLVAVTIGLGHVAGEEVGAGRMSADEGAVALRRSLLRVFRGGDPPA